MNKKQNEFKTRIVPQTTIDRWIADARKQFRIYFSDPKQLLEAIMDRGSVAYYEKGVELVGENKLVKFRSIDEVIQGLSTTYVIDGKMLTLDEMFEVQPSTGYYVRDPGRYDQTLIDRGIISKEENEQWIFSDRLRYNAVIFNLVGSTNPNVGINVYDNAMRDSILDNVECIQTEKKKFLDQLHAALKEEVKQQYLSSSIAKLKEALNIAISNHESGPLSVDAKPALSLFVDQVIEKILRDNDTNLIEKRAILNTVSSALTANDISPVFSIGFNMLAAKESEVLGKTLIAFAAVMLIIASVTLTILSCGVLSPIAVAGIAVAVGLLSAATWTKGASVLAQSAKTLDKVSDEAYTEYKHTSRRQF